MGPPKKGGKSKDGRVKNPPSSDIADLLHEWCLNVGWCYDPRFDTFMFYYTKQEVSGDVKNIEKSLLI